MKHYTLEQFTKDASLPVSIRDSVQDTTAEMHTHNYIEIVLVHAGYGIHLQHNRTSGTVFSSAILKGDVFTILPGEIHSYKQCRHFRIYNLCVEYDFLHHLSTDFENMEHFSSFFNAGRPFRVNQLHLTPMMMLSVEAILKELMYALRSTRKSRGLAVRLALMNLILKVFDGDTNWKQTPGFFDEQLFASIEKLEKKPVKQLNLQQFAREACMSVSSYAHKFKKTVGISPSKYNSFLRLERACHQLEDSRDSLSKIASDNGFCDGNYFSRQFKQHYGISPGRYRIKLQHNSPIVFPSHNP